METKDILKNLRKEKKITANQLSKIFEMEESTISEIERGKRNLTINLLKKYCEYFQQPADYILQLSNKLPNLIYEDEDIILYNSKIYLNEWNDLMLKYKIKFKKENWNTISMVYQLYFQYDTYFEKNLMHFDYKKIDNKSDNKLFKNDETIIDYLIDNKHFTEQKIGFYSFSIRNINLKILKVSKDEINIEEITKKNNQF